MSATTGSFSIGNSTVQMPVKTGTLGPSVVDISKLYAQSGMCTYDPGFTSTASCESEVSYIDGDQGVLLYRGYPTDRRTLERTPRNEQVPANGRARTCELIEHHVAARRRIEKRVSDER